MPRDMQPVGVMLTVNEQEYELIMRILRPFEEQNFETPSRICDSVVLPADPSGNYVFNLDSDILFYLRDILFISSHDGLTLGPEGGRFTPEEHAVVRNLHGVAERLVQATFLGPERETFEEPISESYTEDEYA